MFALGASGMLTTTSNTIKSNLEVFVFEVHENLLKLPIEKNLGLGYLPQFKFSE